MSSRRMSKLVVLALVIGCVIPFILYIGWVQLMNAPLIPE
ncbi:hypothetical protein SAMN02799630_01779 [Paenibacillus sp. UNCCL117]|nr:hypothetical protein SAMN04488602_104267 [Paenibacillus sp. cl123]SFW29599.1 hypothetical protein SAMN02799630_01779 [Paenibacillus sp. UNCCL117]